MILISEAAHLIWVLQCERVIHGKHHTEGEIKSRWKNVLNTRLTCDRITTTKIKHKNKFTNLVKSTWKQLLQKDRPLPHNWIHNHEVLVGSRPQYAYIEDPIA